jgi:hypothetical protein
MSASLSRYLRSELAKTTSSARAAAELAARAALENLAVHERQARAHMDEPKRKLRAALRARGKALGDDRSPDGVQELTRLVEHTAYEHWHRLLFTRFLTENHLLLMPDDAGGAPTPVTLEECEELAPELRAKDGFDLACRFAGRTLPGVFRADDPVLELTFAPESQVALRRLLESLAQEIFTADDALGWTYQFWQAQRKDEVNASGKKIGADELSPVTQLFTEDYMVEFLLHNTLGAWWAGRCATISTFRSQLSSATTEAAARAAVALPPKNGAPGIEWTYLRLVEKEEDGRLKDETANSDTSLFTLYPSPLKTWQPAAGSFSGWPKTTREITMLDPCMGSGHFLVFALPLLVRLRIEEEGLSAAAAVAAVIRDNLHGLELDERCTQIAAFNLALAAWKLAGYQPLPALHLACSGLAPHASEAEWVALAGNNEKLQRGIARLHELFEKAPVLGSLINPRTGEGDLLMATFHELNPLLDRALAQEAKSDTIHEMNVTVRGLAKAAEILASQFTLVTTNVPYLGRGKQVQVLQDYCESVFPVSKSDLATCFIERCLEFCRADCSSALVTPQNWLFLGTYKKLRESLLRSAQWKLVARLGPKGFQTPMWDFNVMLFGITKKLNSTGNWFCGIDVAEAGSPSEKTEALRTVPTIRANQQSQLANPDARITLGSFTDKPSFHEVADTGTGLQTFDRPRFIASFWEVPISKDGWLLLQSTPQSATPWSGMEEAILWEQGTGGLYDLMATKERVEGYSSGIWRAGSQFWGQRGVLHGVMGRLPFAHYLGGPYDTNAAVLIPKKKTNLLAIAAFSASGEFATEVRRLDQKLMVTNATFTKVPFDLFHWQKVAIEKYPEGLPKPHSSDPTQWLFNGHPKGSNLVLHVAIARLLGYRWPRQQGSSFPDCPAIDSDGLEKFSDADGIVCLAPINREPPAAARLRHLLAAALGSYDERALLAATGPKGSKSKTFEDWLRDEAFEQHCALFHDRPFVWHLWDGLKDGFHVLVHYHRLDHDTLEKLTFSYLGEWIRQQAEDAKADKSGAPARLGAAQALQDKLKAILTGEAPLDLFVRWKPLKEQAIGWHPDLNDGIRQNIRPFLLAGDVGKKGAGLFRTVPLTLKENDRGTEPVRPRSDYPWFWCEEDPGTDPKGDKTFVGIRWNTAHLTLATKRAARQ